MFNNSGAYGVYIAPEPENAYVEGTLIFCAAAIHAPAPIKFDGGSNQIFIGGVHTSGTYDIDDTNARGGTVYILNYSTGSHNLHPNSIVIDRYNWYLNRLVLHYPDKTKGVDLRALDGNIELWRDDGVAFIDFKDSETEDYRVRIQKRSDDGIKIVVDGTGADITALDIEPSGRNKPYIFKLPTSAPASPEVGDAYFDSSTATLYIYDGTTWKSVSLT